MSSLTYTGTRPIIYTTTGTGGGQAGQISTGTTRWNTQTNTMEMFDGYQWVAVAAGEVQGVTLTDMVENSEDRIGAMIEEECADNVTIQDAFRAWQEANERFRVILAIAEKK